MKKVKRKRKKGLRKNSKNKVLVRLCMALLKVISLQKIATPHLKRVINIRRSFFSKKAKERKQREGGQTKVIQGRVGEKGVFGAHPGNRRR